ncbi:MAG: hypothetical protein IPJ48_15550 [Propionivibrio sp.]|uniref:Uncharacterized protein n=1 Tax=Candidatus Propionivibrio dominans TaxID=2954373 RepID=A0A9D7FDH0_9RHOO|nr:hypothetical protein [Candidatus Propionivibrio dominans]
MLIHFVGPDRSRRADHWQGGLARRPLASDQSISGEAADLQHCLEDGDLLCARKLHPLSGATYDFSKEAGGIVAGNEKLLSEIVWPHFWALQIVLLVIILNYCVIRELGRVLGERRMLRMFFHEPAAASLEERDEVCSISAIPKSRVIQREIAENASPPMEAACQRAFSSRPKGCRADYRS